MADPTPECSASGEVTTYVKRKRIALAQEILPKTKIYLDTKYWVLLRDARLQRAESPAVTALLGHLERAVASGRAVCPLNADIVFEVLKQHDPVTLSATVQLLDDLSGGICLLPMTERIQLEIAHFLTPSQPGSDAVYQRRELVWTKAAYYCGFVTPHLRQLTSEQNVLLQKDFADYLWHISLTELFKVKDAKNMAAGRSSPFRDISAELNQGKRDHIDEHKSFKSVFLSEVHGIVDLYKPEFAAYMQYMFERDSGKSLSPEERANDDPGQEIAGMIYNAFRLDRIKDHFPTIRIGAGLHAAVRWDRNRKYKANDLFDFRHAEAALPYCDFFFTEHPLRSLLQDRNLGFEKHFKCQAMSDPGDALAAVEKL